MADKDFGVKRINLISDLNTPAISIGTSTITYNGILGLNASTVAISTNVSIGGSVVSNIIVSGDYSVGIGTTNPTSKLWVQGDVKVSGTLTATSFVGSGSSLTGLVSNQLASVDTDYSQYLLLTKSQSGTSTTISSSYSYIVYNPNSKRLGIGTDSPTENLDVNGTGRFIGTVTAPTFQGTATTATTALGFSTSASVNTSGIITATGGFNIGIQSSGTNITTGVITAINFVGSGNTFSYNSTTKVIDVTISGSSVSGGSSVSISSNTTNQNQYIPYATSFGNTTGFGATTLLVYNPSTGNLGIGTTNPTSKLHVQGDILVSGVTTSGGVTVTTGNDYKVGVNTVLNSTTLGTGVTISSLTSVGTLNQLNVSTSGITTVGFITASSLYVTGVTTSGGVTVTTGNDYKIGVNTVLNSTTLGTGVTNSSLTSLGTLRQLNVSTSGITTLGVVTSGNIYSTGIITASKFSTGISSENVGFTTNTISGPPTIYINPYKVGLSSGTVRIVGNLIVEGSTTTETQATIETSAKTIGVAVSETSNIELNGAGIGIGSTSIKKTLLWASASPGSLKSSENFNLANGKSYYINDGLVLSSTELASSVTTASGITSVGTLQRLVVSSNTSTDAVRITQTGSGNALIVEDEANPDGTAFIVSSDGSIGIGTTIPAYKLTITNNALPTLGLTHAIADFTGSVDGYTQLNIRNSLAAASASADLIATADTGSDTTNFIDLGINNSTFSSGSWTVNGALDGYLYTSDGSLSIGIATNNTAKYISFFAGGLLAANEQVRITGIGSVGIGTTNPGAKLHTVYNNNDIGLSTGTIPVPGIILHNSGGDASLWLGNDNQVSAGLGTLANNGSVIDLSGKFSSIDTYSSLTFGRIGAFKENNTSGDYSGYLSLYSRSSLQNLTEALRIDSSQRVGIGTTNPTSKLHVAGNVLISGISTLGVTTTTNLTSQQLNVSGITTTQTLNVGTGGTVITTTAGGYVGIGTTNPIEVLDVFGNISIGTNGSEPAHISRKNSNSGIVIGGGTSAAQSNGANIELWGSTHPDHADRAYYDAVIHTFRNNFVEGTIAPVCVSISTSTSYFNNSVGIGTTNPGEKLQVDGNIRVGISTTSNYIAFRGTYNDNQTSYTHTFIGERLYERTGGSANNERSELLLFKGNDPTSTSTGPGPDRIRLAAGEIRFDTITVGLSTAGTFEQIGVSTFLVNKMILTSDGNLGIGTTNPTQKLHVQGNVLISGVTTSTDFDSLSDFNLKTNIQKIDDSLAKVIQIRGVTFNWKDTNRGSAGVIAQEVEKVLPELVNGEEIKTVNYNGVIGALVEAVKELKVENDVLRERLDEVYKKVFE